MYQPKTSQKNDKPNNKPITILLWFMPRLWSYSGIVRGMVSHLLFFNALLGRLTALFF